eukprot:Gb_20323 [translate_table: standard]
MAALTNYMSCTKATALTFAPTSILRCTPRNTFLPRLKGGGRRSMSMASNGQVATAVHPLRLTYLEGNSWLWEVGGVKILVDPILVGNLDFGIPWLYDAAKKKLKNFRNSRHNIQKPCT